MFACGLAVSTIVCLRCCQASWGGYAADDFDAGKKGKSRHMAPAMVKRPAGLGFLEASTGKVVLVRTQPVDSAAGSPTHLDWQSMVSTPNPLPP